MSLWRRILRGMRAQTRKTTSEMEDPELLLLRAQSRMQSRHAEKRERAVQTITQKNLLEASIHDSEQRVANLSLRIQEAHSGGDEILMSRLMLDKESVLDTLGAIRLQWEIANEASQQVKIAIRRDEEQLRRKTAEALALRTQWKLIQVEQALTISMAQLSVSGTKPATIAEVQRRHRRNKERVVEAMAHKSYLQRLATDTRETAERLRTATEAARRRGDESEERSLLRDMEQHEATLATTDAALNQAILITDRAQSLIEAESVHFRALRKSARADDLIGRYSESAPVRKNRPWLFLLIAAVGIVMLFVYWLN